MSRLSEKWSSSGVEKEKLHDKLARILKPSQPARGALIRARKELEAGSRRMEKLLNELRKREKELFEEVTKMVEEKNLDRASMLSQELSEVRKLIRMSTHSRAMLDGVAVKLESTVELGDSVATLIGASKVVREVTSRLPKLLPEAENEMLDVVHSLENVINTLGGIGGPHGRQVEPVDDEARRILEEATELVKKRKEVNKEKRV